MSIFSVSFLLAVVFSDQDVDRWQNKEREKGADRHTADEHQTDGITCSGTWSVVRRYATISATSLSLRPWIRPSGIIEPGSGARLVMSALAMTVTRPVRSRIKMAGSSPAASRSP